MRPAWTLITAMAQVSIQKISLDANRHVRVQPVGTSYGFIWRDASSVRWDDSKSELYTLEVQGFDAHAEFKQIIKAIKSEYGDDLVLSPTTQFEGVPEQLIVALRRCIE